MSFIIRPMQKSDLDEVFDIETRAHIAPWSKGIIHDCIDVGYSCFVLAKKRKVQGFYISRIAAGECHLLNLCIAPEAQRKKYGESLLIHLLDQLKMNCSKIILEVRPTNLAAIKLYEKYEFKQIGTRKDYYTNPDSSKEDALVLAKSFNGQAELSS